MTWATDNNKVKVAASGGQEYEFEADYPFADAVKAVAYNHNWKRFRVFIGDVEIYGAADAPSTVGDADGKILVTPQDKGAGK